MNNLFNGFVLGAGLPTLKDVYDWIMEQAWFIVILVTIYLAIKFFASGKMGRLFMALAGGILVAALVKWPDEVLGSLAKIGQLLF
ncbi:TcpD family membrane protein [Staphylococcus succinus]|uniref:TcpD family membrane protein n=1 Tax=Staphylococcus succinus TaxID=61015 RepID=UPI000D1EF32A|nr:TcpD family membrane protein [Staphylococcus succinus]PTI45979.1 hypothetical protein BU060_11400 [Staphylococcus succinus]